MRIMIIGPHYEAKGGISTVLKQIKENLDTTSFVEDIHFYSSWNEGTRIYIILYSIVKLMLFPLLLFMKKIDIVHIHFAKDGSYQRAMYYAKISKFFGKKVILHSHSGFFDSFYSSYRSKSRMKKEIIENCDYLIVLGEYWKKFFETEIGFNKEKIIILNNSVLIPTSNQYEINSNIITFFGKLCKEKGMYDLLDIANYFKQNNSNLIFKIYGIGEIERVKKICEDNKLDNVKIMGWISTAKEKENAISEAILNVLPSYFEGMPMAVLETMAYGVPNITTKVGSIDEVVISENNGFLVEPGNKKEIINIIEFFTESLEAGEKELFSRRARHTIKENYSLENYLNRLINIYNQAGD